MIVDNMKKFHLTNFSLGFKKSSEIIATKILPKDDIPRKIEITKWTCSLFLKLLSRFYSIPIK